MVRKGTTLINQARYVRSVSQADELAGGGMTKVADIERIRWAHYREGVSVRELARSFHKSRKTIRRALADPGPWTYRETGPRGKPVMDAVVPIVLRWLEEDQARPRKQRHTAKRVWERLREEHGFTGAESTVRQWIRENGRPGLTAVTLPLAHDPGAEGQIDFGEAQVRIAGEVRTVQFFCGRLSHSTRDVVVAYSRQDRAAWLDGHVTTFTIWGGAPASIWYDNPSTLGRLVGGASSPATSSRPCRARTASEPTTAPRGRDTRRGWSRIWSATCAAPTWCRCRRSAASTS
jgi:transposase